MTDAVAFVLGSDARRAVLTTLADGPASGRDVVEACDASESAVYDGFTRLVERDLAAESEEGTWRLTGAGRLVARTVERCERVERLIDAAPEFWASHEVECLPESFQERLDRFADCEVIHSPEEDPFRVARRFEEAIRDGATIDVLTPIYSDRTATAFAERDAVERRLVLTPEMVERILRDEPGGPAELDGVEVRVQAASLGLTLTDAEVLVSLPDCEGGFDANAAIHATSDGALRWGRDLFEHYWRQATPVAEWTVRELPELAAASDAGACVPSGSLAGASDGQSDDGRAPSAPGTVPERGDAAEDGDATSTD